MVTVLQFVIKLKSELMIYVKKKKIIGDTKMKS